MNVGYFTDVSLRNCSMSKGEDLTLAIELSQLSNRFWVQITYSKLL